MIKVPVCYRHFYSMSSEMHTTMSANVELVQEAAHTIWGYMCIIPVKS